jgi:phosphatidylglycerophosphate synthase
MKKRIKKEKKIKHARVIDTFTGWLERRILHWLVARLPGWVTPDMLTFLGLVGAITVSASYLLCGKAPGLLWLACLGFVINWFGDSLDGTLARYRRIERPRYGFFVDHSVDAVCTTLIFYGLSVTAFMRFDIAMVALVGYLLLTIYTCLSTYAVDEFKISYAYLGPTEIRLIAVICGIVTYINPQRFVHLPFGDYTFFELIMLALIVLFYSAFILSTVGQTTRLAREDKPQLMKK